MPKFRYVATNPEGQRIDGVTAATSGAQARSTLIGKNLNVVELEEKRSVLQFQLTKKKVPRAELMHFSRQMAAFVRAGVPILDAIQIIHDEVGNPRLREILHEVGESLREGSGLSAAFSVHEEVFPRFYVDMLRSAEFSGQLDRVLDQLSRYIERDLEARQKIRSALAYPSVIFFLSLITVGILTGFVLPRFAKFFESLNAKLPLSTRILIGLANFVSSWWWALLGGMLAATVLLIIGGRSRKGRELRDRMLLRLPAIGPVVQFSIIERFCRVLAAMMGAGVPLPEAMDVVAESTANSVYESRLREVREAMVGGEGLSTPLARSELFPPSVIQMIRVGEETGTLDEQLETAASYYEQELGYKIKKLTTLFEPAVIIFMGVVVGFVAISVISAMYGIFRQAESL